MYRTTSVEHLSFLYNVGFSILLVSTTLMKPNRPKRFRLQLVIYIYIYIYIYISVCWPLTFHHKAGILTKYASSSSESFFHSKEQRPRFTKPEVSIYLGYFLENYLLVWFQVFAFVNQFTRRIYMMKKSIRRFKQKQFITKKELSHSLRCNGRLSSLLISIFMLSNTVVYHLRLIAIFICSV